MRLARRLSSALVLLGMAPSGLAPAAPFPTAEPHGLLVTVSETSSDRAILWVRGDTPTPVRLRYAPTHAPDATTSVTLPIDAGRDQTGRTVLDHLTPGIRYA